MSLVSIFPNFIYRHKPKLEEIFLVQSEIKKILPNILETDNFDNPKDWNDGVKTNIITRYNTIKDYNLKNLESYIEKHVRNYIQEVQSFEPVPTKMCHSWINFTNLGQGQKLHQHQDAYISGVYYYQTTSKDGNIVFKNPNPFVELELFPFGNLTANYVTFEPTVGQIILFPGWLAHSVEENPQNSERISISFNYLRDNFDPETISAKSI